MDCLKADSLNWGLRGLDYNGRGSSVQGDELHQNNLLKDLFSLSMELQWPLRLCRLDLKTVIVENSCTLAVLCTG